LAGAFDVVDLVKEFKGADKKETLKGHTGFVHQVVFSPDGKSLYSGGGDRMIKVWSIADGTVTRELSNPAFKPTAEGLQPDAHPGYVNALRFTPDGKYLISAGSAPQIKGYLAVWNAADGKLLYSDSLPLGTFFSLAIAPDAKHLAVGCSPQKVGGQDVQWADAYLLKMPDAVK
jgi:WD40 repeat protein